MQFKFNYWVVTEQEWCHLDATSNFQVNVNENATNVILERKGKYRYHVLVLIKDTQKWQNYF